MPCLQESVTPSGGTWHELSLLLDAEWLDLFEVQRVLHRSPMSARRNNPKIVFLSRLVAGGLGPHIVECTLCVWDVTDYCGEYVHADCILDDQLRTHASSHGGFARVVEGVKP